MYNANNVVIDQPLFAISIDKGSFLSRVYSYFRFLVLVAVLRLKIKPYSLLTVTWRRNIFLYTYPNVISSI